MSGHLATRPSAVMTTLLALLFSLIATLTITQPASAQTDLFAELTGAAEVPVAGDPDGSGFASVFVDAGAGEVCVFIEVVDIATATAAHIHAGAEGVAGAVVVTLPTPDASGVADGCVTGLDALVLQDIHDNPQNYYVNVHNADYPDGALRGQLTPPPVTLFALLDGASEVPGPGDPDGQGFAALEFFVDDGEVCAFIDSSDISVPTAAHIHVGPEGAPGPVVVTLPAAAPDGSIEGCVTGLDPVLLQQIVDAPASYYVNVHTADFPDGAIRGQLSTEPPPPPDCAPGELCNGIIGPGTYTYTGFGTDLTFSVVSDWFFVSDEIPSMSLYDPVEPGALYGFPFVGQVFADPCNFDSVTTIADSPAELITWLGDRDFLDTTAAVPVTYGGAAGFQIDLTGVTLPPECTDPPWVLVFSLPIVGDFHFEEGSTGRIVVLDVAGETLVFVVEHVAFKGSGDPTAFFARAQGVLNSFIFSLPGAPPPPSAPPPVPAGPALPNTAVEPIEGTHSLAVIGVGLGAFAIGVLLRRRRLAG